MDRSGASHAVVAAGGIVRRNVDGAMTLALVRRERHTRDEWTLPKGKVAAQDESLPETARREVSEETGTCVELGAVAGVIDYRNGDDLKVVVFWLMTYVGESSGDRDTGEVSEVRWVPISDAVSLLTHPKERALLDTVSLSAGLYRLPRPRLRQMVANWLRRPQMARLREEVTDLAAHLAQTGSPGEGPQPWRAAALHHVARAREAATTGDVDTGWNQTYRAREFLIAGYDADEVTRAAVVLRDELEVSGKFSEWRRAAARHLLEPVLASATGAGPMNERDRSARLQEGVRIRNENFANEYRKLTLLRRHQRSLLSIGSASMLILIMVLAANAPRLGTSGVDQAWLMVAAVLLGVVGAVTSAAQRSSRISHGRIPHQLGSYVASTSRVPIGAVAGLLVWLAGNTGLAPSTGTAASILVGAFAAGFTERLVAAPGDHKN